MAKRKKQTNDFEIIEAYFTTENEHYNCFTLDIYNEAKENNLFTDIKTPLWIFDIATSEFYESRNKPLQVLNELKETFIKEKLNKEQQAFILENLISYFKNTVYNDDKSKEIISLSKVEKLLKKELEHIKPTKANKTETEYNWNKTIIHLETLPELKDKIVYLLTQKTRYKQESGYDFEHPNFGEKCELEISKINNLLSLEQLATQPKAKPQLEGYTNSQLVLIFYYFFKQNGLEPRVSIDISPLAKFIHLITGREFKAVTSSDFYKKLQTVPNFKTDKELINDLEAIKPLFKKVQLIEVVKMIENEIDLARNEMKQAKKK
jgi:hypothetical protein